MQHSEEQHMRNCLDQCYAVTDALNTNISPSAESLAGSFAEAGLVMDNMELNEYGRESLRNQQKAIKKVIHGLGQSSIKKTDGILID